MNAYTTFYIVKVGTVNWTDKIDHYDWLKRLGI